MPAKPSLRRPRVWLPLAGMPLCLFTGFVAARLTTHPGVLAKGEAAPGPAPAVAEPRQVSGKPGVVKLATDGGVFQEEREWIKRFQAATPEELPGLWNEIPLLRDVHERQALWDLLYQKWVAEMLAGITDPAVRQNAVEQSLKNMLEQDPDKAEKLLEALPANTLTAGKRGALRQTIADFTRLTASERESLFDKLL